MKEQWRRPLIMWKRAVNNWPAGSGNGSGE